MRVASFYIKPYTFHRLCVSSSGVVSKEDAKSTLALTKFLAFSQNHCCFTLAFFNILCNAISFKIDHVALLAGPG
jgi:hypothetical protein